MAERPENLEGLFQIPIEWRIPEGVISRYATHFLVQHGEHEITLFFFEMQVPFVIGPDEEKRQQLSKIRSVEATCVARVVVAPERLEELVGLLQENLETYRSRQKVKAGE